MHIIFIIIEVYEILQILRKIINFLVNNLRMKKVIYRIP